MRTKFYTVGLILGLVCLWIAGLSLALGAGMSLEEADITFDGVYEIHRGPDGTLVISDYGASQVWTVDPDTDGYAAGAVGRVTDAQADQAGNLWWADGANSFSTLPAAGTSMTTWTAGTDRQLYGVAFDDEDHVWLTEWFGFGSKLYRFTPPSVGTTELCTYTLPTGTWSYYLLYRDGNLWLLNWWNDEVVRFAPTTRAVTRWTIGDVSADWQGIALDAEGNFWWADAPSSQLSRLDPGTHERANYALPVGTTPQMVEARDGQIWYTEGVSGTVGILDPAIAISSTETLLPQSSTALAPVCSEWGSGTSSEVNFTTGTLQWTTATLSIRLDAGGWMVYELPLDAQPFGLSSSGAYEWVTDQGRQKLVRLATVQEGVLSLTMSPSSATVFHGDLVTYTYTATYASDDDSPANTVQVQDDTCSPVVFVGGDGNGNSELDVDETWTYHCAYTIPSHVDGETDPIVTTASLTGKQADDQPATSGQDTATVDVMHREGALSLDLSASDTEVQPGQTLTYTYALQYASDDGAPAQNLTVTDDLCAPVTGPDPVGDANDNGYLDAGETWVYLCQYAVPDEGSNGADPIMNTATAAGEDMDGDSLAPVQDTATVTLTSVQDRYSIYLPMIVRLY